MVKRWKFEQQASESDRRGHARTNILQPDGSLVIRVPSTEVSWYDFLAYSRVHNSEHGGWNSKTFWSSRALYRLATDPLIAATWTERSLDAEDPAPRSADFRLDRAISDARQALASLEGDESENRLNVRLFQAHSQADNRFEGRVRFFGFEVPLSSEKSGMLKIDLLGEVDGRELAIIELKKHNGGDSPLMAFTEAVCYGLQVIRCKQALISELKQERIGWDGNQPINLLIAAPVAYWAEWLSRDAEIGTTSRLEKALQPIVASINTVLTRRNEPCLRLSIHSLPRSIV